MTIVLVTLIGSMLGWLATIIARVKSSAQIAKSIFAGILGAMVGGLLANNGTLLGGLSIKALMSAIAGAVLVLAAYHLAIRNLLN